MSGRGIEFVENREPQGCFGADVEALTGIDQDDVHNALAKAGLYAPDMGLQIVSAADLNSSMRTSSVPASFTEELPFFNGFEGDEIALDTSPDVVKERLETLQEGFLWDHHQGTILFYPCRRNEADAPFGHFVAVVEPQEEGATLTVMDPSELPGHGGVFQKTEEEALKMLTPNTDMMIPVLAYAIQMVPVSETEQTAEAGATDKIGAEVEAEMWERALAL